MDFLKKFKKLGIVLDKSFHFTERKSIDRSKDLKFKQELNFGFHEMKINKEFIFLLGGSLSGKIKADCAYDAILFLDPLGYNKQMYNEYAFIEKEIRELNNEILEGGLFKTDELIDEEIKKIKGKYDLCLSNIAEIEEEYKKDKIELFDYNFETTVHKLENQANSVKRVDFLLGIEPFTYIAESIESLNKYKLALTPIKED